MPNYCFYCRSPKVQEIVEGNQVFYSCPVCHKKSGRTLSVDNKILIINTARGIKHRSAAAIIVKDKKMLFTNRRTYPFGLAIPVGHVEYGETLEEALRREIFEEIDLKVTRAIFLSQFELPNSFCRAGSDIEEWGVFSVEYGDGNDAVLNSENEGIVWIPLEEIPRMKFMEPVEFALTKLGYMNDK